MILSAMVLLNGLINIFGDTFAERSTNEDDFYFVNDNEEKDENNGNDKINKEGTKEEEEDEDLERYALIALDAAYQTFIQLSSLHSKDLNMNKEKAKSYFKKILEKETNNVDKVKAIGKPVKNEVKS